GVENLSIDWTGANGGVGIMLVNCTNCWVKGLRLVNTHTPYSFLMHILPINVLHGTIKDNYLYGPVGAPSITNNGISTMNTSLTLFENNILDHNVISFAPDDPESGDVFAYNFIVNSAGFGAPGIQPHQAGDFLNLFEGNDLGTFFSDAIHGTHFFNT